jgi:hypothetical protein
MSAARRGLGQGDGQKLLYALAIGYHLPPEDSPDPLSTHWAVAMAMAAAAYTGTFDDALAVVAAGMYYRIPLLLRWFLLGSNIPPDMVGRVISPVANDRDALRTLMNVPGIIHGAQKGRPLTPQSSSFSNANPSDVCVLSPVSLGIGDARARPRPGPEPRPYLERAWQKLVKVILKATTQTQSFDTRGIHETSIILQISAWGCAELRWAERRKIYLALQNFLVVAHLYANAELPYLLGIAELARELEKDCPWCGKTGKTCRRGYQVRTRDADHARVGEADSDVLCDVEVDGYAGDFWRRVENITSEDLEVYMPGSWVEDVG